jgi:AcrR family transcriptional regulator
MAKKKTRNTNPTKSTSPAWRLADDESIQDFTPRQRQLLEAALSVMSDKGYDGSRTREIAEAAGVSEATLFKNFPTKRDILMALLKPFLATVVRPTLINSVKQVIQAHKGAPLEETMREVMRDRIALFRARGPLVKTLLMEAIRHPEILDLIRAQVMPEIFGALDSILDAAEQRGELQPMNRRTIMRMFLSAVVGYLAMSELFPAELGGEGDEAEIEAMVRILSHGVSVKKEKT